MIDLTIAQAIAAVRAALDELQPNESYMAGVTDTDNADLDTIIEKKLVEAVAMVHANAAYSLVAADAPVIASPTATADGLVLKVEVPQNMMRFVAFKATDSAHTVTALLDEGDPEALRQADLYACGTHERPEAVLHRGSTVNKIWYYKLATTLAAASGNTPAETAVSRIERLSYLTYPAIVSNAVKVCTMLKDAVISMLTGLVLTVYKDQSAEAFYSQARLQMGLQETR